MQTPTDELGNPRGSRATLLTQLIAPTFGLLAPERARDWLGSPGWIRLLLFLAVGIALGSRGLAYVHWGYAEYADHWYRFATLQEWLGFLIEASARPREVAQIEALVPTFERRLTEGVVVVPVVIFYRVARAEANSFVILRRAVSCSYLCLPTMMILASVATAWTFLYPLCALLHLWIATRVADALCPSAPVPPLMPHCVGCGYNLTGQTDRPCPECGRSPQTHLHSSYSAMFREVLFRPTQFYRGRRIAPDPATGEAFADTTRKGLFVTFVALILPIAPYSFHPAELALSVITGLVIMHGSMASASRWFLPVEDASEDGHHVTQAARFEWAFVVPAALLLTALTVAIVVLDRPVERYFGSLANYPPDALVLLLALLTYVAGAQYRYSVIVHAFRQ